MIHIATPYVAVRRYTIHGFDSLAHRQISQSAAAIYSLFTAPCRSFSRADSAGYIEISRIDTVRRIISGTFAFTAENECTGAPVRVEQGRFDYQYGVWR